MTGYVVSWMLPDLAGVAYLYKGVSEKKEYRAIVATHHSMSFHKTVQNDQGRAGSWKVYFPINVAGIAVRQGSSLFVAET